MALPKFGSIRREVRSGLEAATCCPFRSLTPLTHLAPGLGFSKHYDGAFLPHPYKGGRRASLLFGLFVLDGLGGEPSVEENVAQMWFLIELFRLYLGFQQIK